MTSSSGATRSGCWPIGRRPVNVATGPDHGLRRLRRRLRRRAPRRVLPGRRDAGPPRRTALPDLRDAWRADAGPRPARAAARTPTPGSRPGPRRSSGRSCAAAARPRIRIVANFGAANSLGAGNRCSRSPPSSACPDSKVGIVQGDDLLELRPRGRHPLVDDHRGHPARGRADPRRQRLPRCATGRRVAAPRSRRRDPRALRRIRRSCSVRSSTSSAGREDDWERLAAGTLAGHLLECSTQLSGGYFADPGLQGRARPRRASAFRSPRSTPTARWSMTKADDTGGLVSDADGQGADPVRAGDPSAYLVPDVTLDVTEVEVTEPAPNRVRVSGARGRPAAADAQGHDQHRGRVPGRGRDLVRRAERAGPRRAGGRRVLDERLRADRTRRLPTRIDLVGTVSTFDSQRGDLREGGQFPPDGDYRVRLAGLGARPGDRGADRRRGDRAVQHRARPGAAACGIGGRPRSGRCRRSSSGASSTPASGSCPRTAIAMAAEPIEVPLHEIAHGRAGDKGNRCNISVIAFVLGRLAGARSNRSPPSASIAFFAHRGATQRDALRAAAAGRPEPGHRRRAGGRGQRQPSTSTGTARPCHSTCCRCR